MAPPGYTIARPMSPSVRRPTRQTQPRLWRRGRLSPLARDIVVILGVKFVVLTALWWAFFSHPVAPHMSVEPQRVGERLFPPAAGIASEPRRADR